MNTRLIKLVTGEEILAEVVAGFVDKLQDSVEIKNAIQVIVRPTNDKENPFSFGFLPWAKFAVGNITISKDMIVYIAEATEEIKGIHNQIFGSIVLPSGPPTLSVVKP